MSTDAEKSDVGMFRRQWRDRQSNRGGPGEVIVQPRWIGSGLAGLVVLLAAGTVAATTLTVAQTASLPAVAQDAAVMAVSAGDAPPVGTSVRFRETSGATVAAVVVESTATQVRARLPRRIPAAVAGQLLVPDGRRRVISVLLPRLR